MTENITGKYGQLRVLNSDQKTYPLKPGRFSIGDEDALKAKIRVYGNNILPIHCIVQVDKNKLVTVIATSNIYKTNLNNKPVRKEKVQRLKYGDVIEIGDERILYENSKKIYSYSNVIKALQWYHTNIRRNSSKLKSFKPRVASPRSTPRIIRKRSKKWSTTVLKTTLFPSKDNKSNLVGLKDKPDASKSITTKTKQQKIVAFKPPAPLVNRQQKKNTEILKTPRPSVKGSLIPKSRKQPSPKLKRKSFIDVSTKSTTEFSSSKPKIPKVQTPGLSIPKSFKSTLKHSRSSVAGEKIILHCSDGKKSASCNAKKGNYKKSVQDVMSGTKTVSSKS